MSGRTRPYTAPCSGPQMALLCMRGLAIYQRDRAGGAGQDQRRGDRGARRQSRGLHQSPLHMPCVCPAHEHPTPLCPVLCGGRNRQPPGCICEQQGADAVCRLTLLFSDIEFNQTNRSATRADCDPSPETELLAGDYTAFQSWKRSPESLSPLLWVVPFFQFLLFAVLQPPSSLNLSGSDFSGNCPRMGTASVSVQLTPSMIIARTVLDRLVHVA